MLTAIELGHDYLVLTDHSPRLTVANGLSVERLTKQLGVVDAINEALAGLPAAQGDRGRHPRRRRARPDRRDARPARRRGRLGALQAQDGAAPMTRRMVAAVSNPRTNVLGHCTGRLVEGGRGTRGQSRSTPRRSSRPAPSTTSRSRSTPGPSVRPARRADRAGPRPRLPVLHRQRRPRARPARLPGLRLRARRAARRPDWTGSSTPGTSTACWSGPVPPDPAHPRTPAVPPPHQPATLPTSCRLLGITSRPGGPIADQRARSTAVGLTLENGPSLAYASGVLDGSELLLAGRRGTSE